MKAHTQHDEASAARARRISVFDGLFYGAMVGLAESYLGTFAVELGHGPTALAVLGALPLLCGALAQLGSGQLARLVGGRRTLVAAGAAVQAVCCLAFASIAAGGSRSFAALLCAKLLFWTSSLVSGPPWSDWMASVVPEPLRPRYFGRRSGAVHLVLFLAFGLGGWVLQGAHDPQVLFVRYQWLFVAAGSARALSACLIAIQPDPAAAQHVDDADREGGLIAALREGEWRTALYLAALMFGAHLAVPFFTPYMLTDLKLSYAAFAGLTAASILTKTAAFAGCHWMAERVGQRALMTGSGVLIALVPVAWAFARSHTALVAAQLLSGVAWAGLEYASFQLLLVSAPAHARTAFLSLANAASGLAQLTGGLLGSLLLTRLALSYPDVFLASAALRGLALVVLVLGLRHLALPMRLFLFAVRIVSVRPAGGTLSRPVAPSVPPPPGEG